MGSRRSYHALAALAVAVATCLVAETAAGATKMTGSHPSLHPAGRGGQRGAPHKARSHNAGGRGGLGSGGAVTLSGGDAKASYGSVNPLLVKNPICDEAIGSQQRRNCHVTGTPEGRYPTSNYGFEIHIDTGLDNIVGNFQALLAQIANAIWMALLFVLNLVLTLLGWALELNPFTDNRAMAKISAGLERFYRAFTSPWLVVAMVAIGAVGLWRGLVRREVSQTIGGTLVTVVLMVAALWVIHEPTESVGRLSELSNKAAQSVIAAPQRGSLAHPTTSYAQATDRVWNAMTLPGFAALNFSNVGWALQKPDSALLAKANQTACLDYAYLRSIPRSRLGVLYALSGGGNIDCSKLAAVVPPPRTNAEIWLRNSPGSPARESLWDSFTDDPPYNAYFAIQGSGGAWTRLPLVVLVSLGLLGGIALLAWLALRIFVQTAVAFVLVLTTPLALFLPAFGEAGRRAFAFWGSTLLGALVSKLIYAAILSIVLFATTVVASLVRGGGGVGTMMGFLIMAALWWAVFLKREQLIGAISLSPSHEGGSGRLEGLAGLYAGVRIGQSVTRPLRTAAGAGVTGAVGGAFGAAAAGRADRTEGTQRVARAQLDRQASSRLDSQYEHERALLDKQAERQQGLAQLGRDRDAAVKAVRSAGNADEHQYALARARELGGEQAELRSRIAAAEPPVAQARSFIDRADDNRRRTGSRWSERDLAGGRELIRREADRPVAEGTHAWRAGMTPERYEALRGRQRQEVHGEVSEQLRRDKLAFGAIPDRPEGLVERRAGRGFRREVRRRGGARELEAARIAAWRERRESGGHRTRARRGVSR
jgi:hypothetical protein